MKDVDTEATRLSHRIGFRQDEYKISYVVGGQWLKFPVKRKMKLTSPSRTAEGWGTENSFNAPRNLRILRV
jgi:hypothetical protein